MQLQPRLRPKMLNSGPTLALVVDHFLLDANNDFIPAADESILLVKMSHKSAQEMHQVSDKFRERLAGHNILRECPGFASYARRNI